VIDKPLLLAVAGPQAEAWAAAFRKYAADLRVWPDATGDAGEIAYACLWRAPHGLAARLPGLRLIVNLGAGADQLLADPDLPDVPILRAANPDLSMRVTEYVVLHVLMHHRRQLIYSAQQREHIWKGHEQPAAREVAVGVMGLGVIGREAARVLARIGFKVAGWSRSAKALDGIETFHGRDGFEPFLARTEILVCLLPSTKETEGILNRALFRKLKRDGAAGGAFLINAGRGKLQIDDDILAALEDGTLAGASLDVFPQEPLLQGSPLWSHPRVIVTPHNAGDIAPEVMAADVARQIVRFERGLPLDNLVHRRRGY
jgi:glyoxylate/hydroxypyruvate reductase A